MLKWASNQAYSLSVKLEDHYILEDIGMRVSRQWGQDLLSANSGVRYNDPLEDVTGKIMPDKESEFYGIDPTMEILRSRLVSNPCIHTTHAFASHDF